MAHKDGVTKFIESPLIRSHIALAAKAHGDVQAGSLCDYMTYSIDNSWSQPLESHLEAVFWIWWYAMVVSLGGMIAVSTRLLTQFDASVVGLPYRFDFVVDLQERDGDDPGAWPNYFASRGVTWTPVIVEVDGHAFHEKTPEQVAKRNERDRAIQAMGWTVLHFSYSELTQRPQECIGEVFDVVHAQFMACIAKANKAIEQVADGADSDH